MALECLGQGREGEVGQPTDSNKLPGDTQDEGNPTLLQTALRFPSVALGPFRPLSAVSASSLLSVEYNLAQNASGQNQWRLQTFFFGGEG